MKILITGGTGLLGKALIESCPMGTRITATYLGEYLPPAIEGVQFVKLDITDHPEHEKLYEQFQPDITIHTAGINSPDYAEKHQDQTWKINVAGTNNIINLCEKHRSKLIYISSNGIYDGTQAPYKEDAQSNPLNYYGTVKLEGETNVKKSKCVWAIVRPILMYGWHFPFERSNIVTLALTKLQKGESMAAYDDVYSNPLYSMSCAETIWKIIRDNKYEVFNIAGADRVSIYQLLLKAAEVFGLDTGLLKPVQQGYFSELAKRPMDTSFDTAKMRKVLDLAPLSLAEGLTQMKKERHEKN